MKVKDLIAQLQTLDPEMLVLGPGYEGGLVEVDQVRTVVISLNVNTEWYYGPHERGVVEGFEQAKGVLIS